MKRFFLGLIAITILIISIFVYLDVINITQFISLTNNYDWLGFFGALLGSVIGGAITFIGVYITIEKQREADEEKNRLSLIPILEYKLSYNKEEFDNSNGQLAGEIISHINVEGAAFDDGKSEEWYFNLTINNAGIGHAQIIEIELLFKEIGTERIVHSYKEGYCYKLIKVDNSKKIMFMIYAPKEHFYENDIPTQEFIYPIDIIVKYQDLLGNKYKQKLKASMSKAVLFDGKKAIKHWNCGDLHYYENFEQIK